MTSNTKVDSGSEPLDTTRFSMSLKPKIPTSSPPSTTKAALRFSDMTVAASITLVSGETIVFGVPERMLPNVLVLASDPAVFDSKGPKRACNAAASALPAAPRATFTNDSAEEGFVEADFSIFEMASLRHLAISSSPTTSSSFPNTGRWRKWFSIIVTMASVPGWFSLTERGFGVITAEIAVVIGSTPLDTTLRVKSVSVMIPDMDPSGATIIAASDRCVASIFETSKTLSSVEAKMGFFGRRFETLFSFCIDASWGCRCDKTRLGPRDKTPLWTETSSVSEMSSISIVELNTLRHPSTPPHPPITSKILTTPTTNLSFSTTGNDVNFPECIISRASIADTSGET